MMCRMGRLPGDVSTKEHMTEETIPMKVIVVTAKRERGKALEAVFLKQLAGIGDVKLLRSLA